MRGIQLVKLSNLRTVLIIVGLVLILVACKGQGPDLKRLASEKLAEVSEQMADVTPGALPERNNTIMPHVFVGSVTIEGSNAIDGVEISVWLPEYDAPIGNGTVTNGKYNLMAHAHGPGSFDGKILIFKIDGKLSGDTAEWESGQASILDLSIN